MTKRLKSCLSEEERTTSPRDLKTPSCQLKLNQQKSNKMKKKEKKHKEKEEKKGKELKENEEKI